MTDRLKYRIYHDMILGLWIGDITNAKEYSHIEKTLQFFIKEEDFEKCATLIKIKKSLGIL